MPVGMRLSGFAESCRNCGDFRSCSSSTKFGSRASCFAVTGADGPVQLDGLEVWAAHYFDDGLWVFFRALHTGAGPVHRCQNPPPPPGV